ncbi:MAG: TolC family protein [Bacteroidota bacterium]
MHADAHPSPRARGFSLGLWLLLTLGLTVPARAQAPSSTAPLTLTLDEAVQVALVSNHALRLARLEVQNADAQVREAWGQVLPQVDVSSSYTRNLEAANPFAGSDAGGLFGSLGFIDWLAFNETARTDADPSTDPIDFGEFQERQLDGLREAGISVGGNENPFFVPNQFVGTLSVSQALYNSSAFAAITGAERLKEINRQGVNRQEQLIVDQVRTAYLQAVLADEQARTVDQSVVRTEVTLREVSLQVRQGIAPKFQRLTAEVQLANLQTQLVQAQNAAVSAVDNLKRTLGIPAEQVIRLEDTLQLDTTGDYLTTSVTDAVQVALERRPDLRQAALAVQLREVDRRLTRAQYLPSVSAFANMSYIGNVPDSRTFTISDPDDPFSFSRGSNSFFSSSYWNPSVGVGLQLSWNLFNGFQTTARMQQRQIAIDRARVEEDQLLQSIQLEVAQALRDLEAARQQVAAQEVNVERAELNYEYASARLREGVAGPLVEREASDLLDQSRVNYLQAAFDYLRARSALETAIGLPPFDDSQRSTLRMTTR